MTTFNQEYSIPKMFLSDNNHPIKLIPKQRISKLKGINVITASQFILEIKGIVLEIFLLKITSK